MASAQKITTAAKAGLAEYRVNHLALKFGIIPIYTKA
jgi:hypothetical protein